MKRILCIRIEGQDRRVGFSPPSQKGGLKPTLHAIEAVAAECKQFTPLVGIDADAFPQSVLLDITHAVPLFGGEAALVERIIATLHALDWQVCIAVAHTPGAAWALAGYGAKAEGHPPIPSQATRLNRVTRSFPIIDNSALPAPCSLLPALPLESLRLPEATIALLHSLGVWRIEELEALPRRELSSRFGPELLDCLDRVTGRLPEPLPAWNPQQQFEVCWSAAEMNEGWSAARRETICAALEHLVRRLAAMLTRAGRGAMRLECLLKCTVGEPLQVTVGLFRPTAWANHLVELLQVQFESLQLPGPVDSMRLAAASTAPLELRQQEMFSAGKTRAVPHHLGGLIDRLSNRLGHTSVMRVRLIPDAQPELACHYAPLVQERGIRGTGWHVPELAKGVVSRFSRRSPTNAARRCPQGSATHGPLCQPRPLRLLTQPLRLPGGIEEMFSYAGRQQRIVRRVGPERIETGWWRGRTVARDYYRIETSSGRCYWVFCRLPSGPWFLHGMFD